MDPPQARPVTASAAEEPEELEAIPVSHYGRPRRPGENRTLIAAAARIPLDDRKAIAATRRRRQAWQIESWDYYDEVPEYGSTVDFIGNLMAKVRLFPACLPDPKAQPVGVDDEGSTIPEQYRQVALDTLERLRSNQGGQAAITKGIAVNFEVAGECYLHATTVVPDVEPGEELPDGEEDWNVRSVDELRALGDEFVLYGLPGSNAYSKIPADDLVIRLWEAHPRFGSIATSATRRLLSTMENLILLDREIRAGSQNRIASNGFLLVPDELSLAGPIDHTRDSGDGDETQDPFFEDLLSAIVTNIQQPGSAGAAAPLGVRGKADYLKEFRWITTARPVEATIDKRMEALIMRLARGLSMPVEVTTGLQETTFANAVQVKKSEWDAYGEPRATLICDAITTGYYQWALEEAGVPREVARTIFVWFDPAAAIAAPDPVDAADKAHEDGLISDEARRRYHGFSEADAPTDDELLRRVVLKATRQDPRVTMAILFRLGLLTPEDVEVVDELSPPPAEPPPHELTTATTPKELMPAEDTEPVTAAAVRVLVAASRRRPIGQRLAAIDSQLRARLHTATEAAMRRAMDRAGNRVNSKVTRSKSQEIKASAAGIAPRELPARLGQAIVASLGVTDDDLLADAFDDLSDDFDSMTLSAQRQAVAALEEEYGPLDDGQRTELDSRMAQGRSSGWDLLAAGLVLLAATRLYNPSPTPSPQGETDATLTVPAGIIRAAMTVAGGGTVNTNEDGMAQVGGPGGGVATGPDVLDTAADQGGTVEGWEWSYGDAPRATPFEPHFELDGYQFEGFDDDTLANTEGWPGTDYFYPGDHDGCICDVIPILLPSGEVDTGGSGDAMAAAASPV